MTPVLQVALVALALSASLLAVVAVVRDEPPGWWLVGVLGVLEVGLVVQCVVGLVQLGGDHDVNAVTFAAYLVGVLLVVPTAFVWALAEQSRSSTAVLIVAGIVVAVLIGRLEQIWTG